MPALASEDARLKLPAPDPLVRSLRREVAISSGISFAVHLGGTATLAIGLVLFAWWMPPPVGPAVIVVDARGERPEPDGGNEPLTETDGERPSPDRVAAQDTAVAATPFVETDRPAREDDTTPVDAPAVGAATVDRLVEAAQTRAQSVDTESQRRQIEDLGERLARSSQPTDVEDAANSVGRAMAVSRRATAPIEGVEGSFDIATAQLHDVVRQDENGRMVYRAVLLDAEGRTTEIDLTETEGQELFKTWTLIKKNPFLERIYRSVVMGLMDQILGKQPGGSPPASRTGGGSKAPGPTPESQSPESQSPESQSPEAQTPESRTESEAVPPTSDHETP